MEQNQKATVSIIIPTLNASAELGPLLETLLKQTRCPDEILVLDSESDDDTVERAKHYPLTRVIEIKRVDFDHGGSRDLAFRAARGDIVLFFTQDAMPGDDKYVEAIVQSVLQEGVACACGRQIARADAPLYEKFTREFNYPPQSNVRDASDIQRLGIKAFFLSDACSAYRREAYLAVGGFDHPILTNEDMLIAAKFLSAGYKIAYCAEAAILHSHLYSLRQEYERNYKIGFVMEKYRDRFGAVRAESEGVRYVKHVLKQLLQQRAIGECFRFCLLCAAKMFGNRKGRRSGGLVQKS